MRPQSITVQHSHTDKSEEIPDMTACDILIGKCALMPNMLPLKMLEAPLTSATLARVPVRNFSLQPDTSIFTSTVVTRNTSRITARDKRIRTSEDSLDTHRPR